MDAPTVTPIYPVFKDIAKVVGAFTGKGTSCQNSHFSFQRPTSSRSKSRPCPFGDNLRVVAQKLGFHPGKVLMPNGAWPHSGRAIVAEDFSWTISPVSKTLVPSTAAGRPVTYDAVATCNREYVLAAQGADCPTVSLCDPVSQVIGIAHAGWKPVVRGVIRNVIHAMIELGAKPWRSRAYISPGAGDRYNAFKRDDDMEPYVRQVFLDANRSELLHDQTIRHEMSSEDISRLSSAMGREIYELASLKLTFLVQRELETYGILPQNISRNPESSIVETHVSDKDSFKYHSYRRERPEHGLNMSVLFLKV